MPTNQIDRTTLRIAIVTTAIACALLIASSLSAQDTRDSSANDSVARRRIQPLPALGSAPETGLQFGATVLAVWEPAAVLRTRPTSLTASVLRTAKSQTRIRLDAERWTTGNARRIAGSLQWQRFPLPYYGIGDQSAESLKETFTPEGTEATLTVQQRIAGAWYATGGVRYLQQKITTDSGRALRTAAVTGATGGTVTEFSAGVQQDTRDNLFAPRAGHWTQLSYARSTSGVLSDYSYGTARFDTRLYRTIAHDHVLATQLQIVGVDGAAPFDQLALVGNSDILRGYARGRYRDRATAALQTEYRSPVWHRVGAVAFGGAGVAAASLGSLGSARVLPTYGAGIRLQIDQRQRTGVRADYGRGRDSASGLYIGFNQAF
jgi:outer membrane translocation and assembly module TamA